MDCSSALCSHGVCGHRALQPFRARGCCGQTSQLGRDHRPAHHLCLVRHAVFPVLANKDSIGTHPRSLYERLGWPSAVVAVVLVFAELALMYVQARRAMRFEPAHVEPLPDDGDADGDETHEGMSII